MTPVCDKSVLFLGKADDEHAERALDYCVRGFNRLDSYLGGWGDPLPEAVRLWEGDLIVSYLCRWVVPDSVIGHAREGAINFHPGPPEYPGIGCNNFALYDEVDVYGVTCHHMDASVDTGSIIDVRRFRVHGDDDVESLLLRTYDYMLVQFYDMVDRILSGEGLESSGETWTRPPFSRAEFERLRRVTADMSHEEVERRIRATSFGPWQPYVVIGGREFALKVE